jgi:hypothetical protein
MTAIAKVLARAFPSTPSAVDVFKQVARFCGTVLLIASLWAAYDLDFSAGFF